MMQRIAAIDIGSQTIRLLIADHDNVGLYPLERDLEIVGLGSGMSNDSRLRPEKIKHATACIKGFSEHARARGARTILAVATASVRQALNRQEFIQTLKQATGIEPDVITGRQESDLTRAGVQAAMQHNAKHTIIIDIGGGSTDFSFLSSGRVTARTSLPIGVIEPAERFMRTDPPAQSEINAMQSWIDAMIASHGKHLPAPQPDILPVIIATAGTATTLAAMDQSLTEYAPARINGYQLSLTAVDFLFDAMIKLRQTQRSKMAGLAPGRSVVILPGALILMRLLHFFKCTDCTVSDAGLLEGIIIQHASLEKLIETT